MFQQTDLFYKIDLSNQKRFNQRIFDYEKARIEMKTKQAQKLLDELREDKEQLRQYKQLPKQSDTDTEHEINKTYLIYLVEEATEEKVENKALLAYSKSPRHIYQRPLVEEETIEYIPSDIKLDIDTKVQKCQQH